MMNRAVPSSSSFTHAFVYDVFLSFRGEDTRTTFTGHLYNSLRLKGFRTFIDDGELRRGEEITPALLEAIQQSRIAIIVFSKSYASSTFCLDELAKILEHLNEAGRLVWPVFYGVDPSEVRHQRGSYGEALSKHQRRFKNDKDKVQKWKLALRKAADISGWHFKQGHEYEYEFIGRIVKEVSIRLKRTLLHIANYPVGLESRVLEINTLLGVGSDDKVDMVGIYGIGGIGKTTVARAVFNSIADQFEGLCFIADVREKSKHSLVQLQETLLSDLVMEKDIKLGDVNRGIPLLKERLKNKKVLVIIDDVDKIGQLIALAGGLDWFGIGSKIIITTRDKHLLVTHGIEKIYEVNELNHEESLDLFRWHAFKSNEVDPSYEYISKCVVDYAKGLPLALEIIGSDLFRKTIKEWESALDTYRRIPITRVREILKVSYDGLDEDGREIFLDIACFFKGYILEYVMDMVQHARGFNPDYGVGVLMDRSLIKIENGCVEMHDLIQDMGREIVRQQSPKEPGKRSRLWSSKDIINFLKENNGTAEVEVIILNLPRNNMDDVINWSGKAFKEMSNLRILIIRNAKFSTGPKHIPDSLRVLEWEGYPSPNLPADFHPNNLLILNLESSCFELIKPLMGFRNLSVMNFEQCKFITQIPDVSCLPNLTEMLFRGCKNLVEVHDSVRFLDKLRILEGHHCPKLKIFPTINGTSLEILLLNECPSLQAFPEVLRETKNLRELYLSGTNLDFPSSTQNLTGVQMIDMQGCERIGLPISFAMLPELNLIHIRACKELQLSKQDEGNEKGSLVMSRKLERLVLRGCNISNESLSICLTWFANVECLELSESNFTILPASIRGCHFLTKLYLDGCMYLREIGGVPPNIQVLSAQDCTLLSSQATSILLNQELHDAGGKVFSLPGARIPKWFNHCDNGGCISFWFRNKFPAVALCVVIGLGNQQPFTVKFVPELIINGNKRFCASGFGYKFSIVADHILVFDLQQIGFYDKLEEAFLEKEWNHVEVSYTKPSISYRMFHPDEFPISKVAKESGVYVFKKRTNMEDIRFTNPYMDREGNQICGHAPSEVAVPVLDSTMSSRLSDIGSNGDLQQPQNSTCINDEGGKNEVGSNQGGRSQFSLHALISWVVSLCSSLTPP